jgi:hypothetical protein
VIYIGGMTRSGSTLLDRLLGELPGVCSIGELMNIWQRGIAEGNGCGCGEPFHACPFWKDVLTLAFGGPDKVDVERVAQLRASVDRTRFIPALLVPSLRPSFRRALDEYLSYCTKLYEAVSTVSGCAAVADSSKNASFAFCLRSSQAVDLKVLHVVRDSRAVAHSWTRPISSGDEPTGSRRMPTVPPTRTAWRWSYENFAFQLLKTMGTPTLTIRYEDLVGAPKETLSKVAEFSGLELRDEELNFIHPGEGDYWAHLGIAHTGSGNPMRFHNGGVRISLDDEWRTVMPASDRRTVTALTAPLLNHYGYLAREPQP